MEIRLKAIELKALEDNKIGGYINVTQRESETLYSKRSKKWFKEIMVQGVFEKALRNKGDIPLLLEHTWENKIASTAEGTLELTEDNIGLRFEAVISDSALYQDIKNRAINSCSFGFKAIKEKIEPVDSKMEKRFVEEIELLEVSLVKNPAYVGSLVETRNYEAALEEERKCETSETKPKERATEEVAEGEKELEKEKSPEKNEEDKLVEEDPAKEDSNNEEDSEKENSEEENSEKEGSNEDEKREFVSNEDGKSEAIKELIDDKIAAKEEELAEIEGIELMVKDGIDQMKQFHKEQENCAENVSMELSYEIAKLRLDILKLKDLKSGVK